MTPLRPAAAARPTMYLAIFASWFACLAWFHPRLLALLELARGPFTAAALVFFIVFTELAWLYGIYNIGVVLFASLHQRSRRTRGVQLPPPLSDPAPRVAILYVTCNDFVEESAASCMAQDYRGYALYLLDDSSDPEFRRRVDAFAARYPGRVMVIRRPDRSGFKAGNLNHACATPRSPNRSSQSWTPTSCCRGTSSGEPSRCCWPTRAAASCRPITAPTPRGAAHSGRPSVSASTSTGAGIIRSATATAS